MAQVQFKAKIERIKNMDGSLAYERIKVPSLTRSHCDMPAFRSHKHFATFANSDMFPSMLHRAAAHYGVQNYIRLDRIPAGVAIDASGFLARVSFDL